MERPSIETYFQHLAEMAKLLIPKPLPTDFYVPIFAELKRHYTEINRISTEITSLEPYHRWLQASAACLISYSEFVSRYVGDGPLTTTLKDVSRNQQSFYNELFNALEYGFTSRGYQRSGCHFDVDTICAIPFPLMMDYEGRFQHTWIISPTGTGKTNLLERLIERDFQQVLDGKASIFVMDSQNELIPKIVSQLPPEKVVLLEPSGDIPLALNMFDNESIDYENSLELADFVIAGLLGANLTAKQQGIFRYLTQALQVIPDATIHTFADLLSKGGYERYRHHIAKLDSYTRTFFDERFNSPSFTSTKEEIFWRLDTIMSNVTFRKMFSHARNKVDLYKELGEAQVICVNTNRAILKAEGSTIMGRFFLAMLLQATERRLLLPTSQRLPVFAYVDECQDYIADEPKVAMLLDKARKQRVAFTFANQRMANIKSADVLDALSNVRTKFAAKNQTDAAGLAKLMRMEPEQLSNMPDWSFVYYQGDQPLTLRVPKSRLERDDARYAEHQTRMRQLYCATVDEQPLEDAGDHAGDDADAVRRAAYEPPPADPIREKKPIVIDGEVVKPSSAEKPKPKLTPKPSTRRKKDGDDIDISPTKEW